MESPSKTGHENQSLSEYGVQAPPEGACVNYEKCGNVPAGKETMCTDCLREARHNDSQTAH